MNQQRKRKKKEKQTGGLSSSVVTEKTKQRAGFDAKTEVIESEIIVLGPAKGVLKVRLGETNDSDPIRIEIVDSLVVLILDIRIEQFARLVVSLEWADGNRRRNDALESPILLCEEEDERAGKLECLDVLDEPTQDRKDRCVHEEQFEALDRGWECDSVACRVPVEEIGPMISFCRKIRFSSSEDENDDERMR